MSAVSISDLQFAYAEKMGNVLQIDQWQLEQRQHCFIYGPSGSGKTTLLNLLGGVLVPNQGQIELLNQDFSSFSSRNKDKFRAQHIGMVFQQFNLVPYLNVLENIQLAAHFTGQKKAQVIETAKTLFERLKLQAHLLEQRADQLSVGQQQRVAIVRALINSPEIIIADEPTSALDSDTRDEFMKLLLEVVNANKSTLIFVSHDNSLEQHFANKVSLKSLNRAGGKDAV